MTTATIDPITRPDALSQEEAARHRLALRVHRATHDGDILVNCLVEFVNGDIPDARASHIHSAGLQLAVMGGYLPQDFPGAATRIHPAATAANSEDNPRPKQRKATLKQILNKPIGEYIRETTQDGGLLIDFLAQLVDPPPNPDIFSKEEVLPTDRLMAAKELLRRGYGSRNPDYYYRTSAAEEKAINSKFAAISRACANATELTRFLLEEVVRNPRRDRYNQPLKHTYTFSQRIWASKYLLWRAFDIPWEHINSESIDAYIHEQRDKERLDAERRIQEAAERKANAAKITPDQEATVMAMFQEMQRQADESDAKAAKKAEKKAAKKTSAASDNKDASADADATNSKDTDNADNKSADNRENTDEDANKSDNTDAADTGNSADAPPGATAAPSIDRGPTAVANALARHPQVDLDTALENHHSTAGIPKQNLTHEQIYDAITAEANFQKRQAIIQRRLHPENPDAPEDNAPPKSRSP